MNSPWGNVLKFFSLDQCIYSPIILYLVAVDKIERFLFSWSWVTKCNIAIICYRFSRLIISAWASKIQSKISKRGILIIKIGRICWGWLVVFITLLESKCVLSMCFNSSIAKNVIWCNMSIDYHKLHTCGDMPCVGNCHYSFS